MSRVENFETASAVAIDIIDAGGGATALVVPDPNLLFSGTYRKIGADLLIEGDGRRVLLQDYFNDDTAPALAAPGGGLLSAETVRALAGLDSQWEFAQAGGGTAPLQIGTVRTLTGSATAQRGGSAQTLAIGDPVFRGDVIETAANSALGITLVDRSVFSLSAGARMVMNELVYDPARTDNSLAVNLVQGSFVFITGQVAKSGSVAVTTPVATMGIRGTTPIVKIDAILGQGDFSLGADPDGTVGSYELVSVITGQLITSVSTTDIVVRIRSAAGPFEILNKTPGEQATDTQLLQPAYLLFQLLGQRGEGTGKGQGLTQLAFNPDSLADLVLTPLLNDTSIKQFDSDFFGRPRQFDVLLNPDGTVTVVERGSLLVDLDPSTDARDSTITFRENGSSLPVAGGVQIAVPAGVTTLTSATVVLTNNQPGDEIIVGSLPAGISVTITSGSIHVNLTGTASVEDYIAAIRAIQFVNNSDNPSTQERIVTVTVTLPTGESSTATTTIVIVAVNDAPQNALPDAQTVAEDGSITFSGANGNAITVSDVDSGGQALTVTLSAQHGALFVGSAAGVTVSGQGTSTLVVTGTAAAINAALDGVVYRPSADYAGGDSLVVSTSDNGNTGEGGVLVTTSPGISITVTPVNDAPVNHNPASVDGFEDTAIVFSSGNGNAITISDVDAGSGTITVRLFTGFEGSSLTLGSTAGVTVSGNGSDVVTVSGTLAAVNAALEGLVYQPEADYAGTDSIGIQTTDNGNSGTGGALSDCDGFVISLAPVNDAPVNHLPSGPQNTDDFGRITFSSATYNAITITDVDEEGGDLTVTLTVQNGTLRIADGSGVDVSGDYTSSVTLTGTIDEINDALDGLEYTSNPGYCYAPDELTITTDDNGNTGAGGAKVDSDVLVINAEFNYAPVANADHALVRVTQADAVTDTVLANDYDGNGDAVRVTGISSSTGGSASVGADAVEIDGAFGTLTIDATGAYTYTVTATIAADTTETETFTYSIADPYGATSTATLTIDLKGNSTPVAEADANFAETGDDFSIGGNVLGNDSDSDGDALSVTSITNSGDVTQPVGTSGVTVIAGAYGTLTIDSTGSYSYEDTATVPHDEYVTETFTYVVSDGNGATATQTLTIVVHGNSRPVAVNDVAPDLVEAGGTDNADAGVSTVSGNVLDNDTDADGDGLYTIPLDFVLYDYSGEAYGHYTIDDAGNYTLTIEDANAVIQSLPGGSSTGSSVYYIVYDEHGAGSYGFLDFTVVGANDAPVGVDDSQRVGAADSQFEPYTGNVLANDGDVDAGAVLTVTKIESAASGLYVVPDGGSYAINGDYGTLTVHSDGSYEYAAFSDGAEGEDVFTYTVSDGALTDTAELVFTVYGYAGRPYAEDDATDPYHNAVEAGVMEGSDAAGNVLANDDTFDPCATELLVTGIRGLYGTHAEAVDSAGTTIVGQYGTLTIFADGHYEYAADDGNPVVDAMSDGDTLVDSFVYTVAEVYGSGTDEPGLTSTARLDVTIEGQNDAPRVTTATTFASEDQASPIIVNLSDFVSDPEGDFTTISVSGVTASYHGGAVTIAYAYDGSTQQITIDPSQFYFLEDSDGCGPYDAEQLEITVTFTASDGSDETYGEHTIVVAGANEGQTFTGVGSAVELIDLDDANANFAKTDTIVFEAGPGCYETDEIINFNAADDRIDVSALLAGTGVTAGTIGDYVTIHDDGYGTSTILVDATPGTSGDEIAVASVSGIAYDGSTLSAGDTIEIAFDSAGNSAQVAIV